VQPNSGEPALGAFLIGFGVLVVLLGLLVWRFLSLRR
jgi:hypothetical protein